MRRFMVTMAAFALTSTLCAATAQAAMPSRAQRTQYARAVKAVNSAKEYSAHGTLTPKAVTARRGEHCWSGVWYERWWKFLGHTIGAIWVYQNGWCGNGHRITRDFGWHFRTYAWGPYCMTNVDKNGPSWDIFPSWKHAQIHASLGVSYPWGCGGLRSGTASLRIAANGWWGGEY